MIYCIVRENEFRQIDKNRNEPDEAKMIHSCKGNDWYRAYCDTMLRSKEENLLTMIDCALEAIRRRVLEINPDSSSSMSEVQQLQEALYYLTLLLENASRGGKFILC